MFQVRAAAKSDMGLRRSIHSLGTWYLVGKICFNLLITVIDILFEIRLACF